MTQRQMHALTRQETRDVTNYLSAVLGYVSEYAMTIHQTEEKRLELLSHIQRASRVIRLVADRT